MARRDLLGIVDYLITRSPQAAASTLDSLQRGANSLKTSPARGRVVPELERLHVREYRELVIPPYRLIYRIPGSAVIVLAALDSRRSLEDLLLERLVGGR